MSKADEMVVSPFTKDGMKWNRIEELALLEAEKAKPSSDPAYWAKRSCKHCYGRGVTGRMHIKVQGNVLINDQLCACARKNFVLWRDDFCRRFLEEERSRAEGAAILESPDVVDKVL